MIDAFLTDFRAISCVTKKPTMKAITIVRRNSPKIIINNIRLSEMFPISVSVKIEANITSVISKINNVDKLPSPTTLIFL
ncbi:unnamed protein product, partial [marine sediment metagenome]